MIVCEWCYLLNQFLVPGLFCQWEQLREVWVNPVAVSEPIAGTSRWHLSVPTFTDAHRWVAFEYQNPMKPVLLGGTYLLGGTWGAQSWGRWWCKYPIGASCCRRRIPEHTFAEAKSITVEIQMIMVLSHPTETCYPEQLARWRPEECLQAQHWASLCHSKGSETRIWAKSGPCLYWWLCCPPGFGTRGWVAAGVLMEPHRRQDHQRLHSVTFFKCWALSAAALCSFIILIDESGLWSIARMLLS